MVADGDDAGRGGHEGLSSVVGVGSSIVRVVVEPPFTPLMSMLRFSEREAASHFGLLKDITYVVSVRVMAFLDVEVGILDVELECSYISRPYNLDFADAEVHIFLP